MLYDNHLYAFHQKYKDMNNSNHIKAAAEANNTKIDREQQTPQEPQQVCQFY